MEGEQSDMGMNGIDAQGPVGPQPTTDAQKSAGHAAGQNKTRRPADRIELSDQAKQLLKDSAVEGASREEIVEASRRRLESGELYTPEAFKKAAKNLLDSGGLDGTDAE